MPVPRRLAPDGDEEICVCRGFQGCRRGCGSVGGEVSTGTGQTWWGDEEEDRETPASGGAVASAARPGGTGGPAAGVWRLAAVGRTQSLLVRRGTGDPRCAQPGVAVVAAQARTDELSQIPGAIHCPRLRVVAGGRGLHGLRLAAGLHLRGELAPRGRETHSGTGHPAVVAGRTGPAGTGLDGFRGRCAVLRLRAAAAA